MHYKAGRLNHDFQIVHFLVGACHTADAAHALLNDLIEDRSNALKMLVAAELREQAKRLGAQRVLDNGDADDVAKLNAKADIAEIDAMAETKEKNKAAAEAELAFLRECLRRVQPHRRFAHLTDAEAAQAAQEEEWFYTLVRRVQNQLITMGGVAPDDFDAVRLHPRGYSDIVPIMDRLKSAMKRNDAHGVQAVLDDRPQFRIEDVLPYEQGLKQLR